MVRVSFVQEDQNYDQIYFGSSSLSAAKQLRTIQRLFWKRSKTNLTASSGNEAVGVNAIIKLNRPCQFSKDFAEWLGGRLRSSLFKSFNKQEATHLITS